MVTNEAAVVKHSDAFHKSPFCFLIRPLVCVCVRVQLLLAKISDTFGICKALLGPFHCLTALITWKHSRQWSDFTHLKVTQPKLKGFCLGGGTSFLSLPYISYNDGAKIRKPEISN